MDKTQRRAAKAAARRKDKTMRGNRDWQHAQVRPPAKPKKGKKK